MEREKVKQFSAPGPKTPSTPPKNPERIRGRREGVEGRPGARDGAEEGDTEWADGGQEARRRGRGESAASVERGPDCTAVAHMSEKPEEGATAPRQGGSSNSESSEPGKGKPRAPQMDPHGAGAAPPGHTLSAHRARKDGARVEMNATAHQ